MKTRVQRRRRNEDHLLDAACAEIHGKLMNLGKYPMTTAEYVVSFEYAAISIAAVRGDKA